MTPKTHVSLVMIETKHHDLATAALRNWTSRMEFAEVITLSTRPLLQGARFVPINPITSKRDHAELMLKCLWPFVKTDYVIQLNWDTLLRDPEHFRPDFFDYDYIGHMWPWQAPRTNNTDHCGISWRSRRLLDSMRYPMVQPIDESTPFHQSENLRKTVQEKFNLRMDSVETYRQFCLELDYPDDGRSFAYRGLWHMIEFLPKKEVEFFIINSPANLFDETRTAHEIVAALVNRNYLDFLEMLADRIRQSVTYDALIDWLQKENFPNKSTVLRILK